MQDPRIATLTEKKLVCKRMTMSFAENRTPELWKSFMPFHKEILHQINDELFSIQVYPPDFFASFDVNTKFVKLAAVEVKEFSNIPEGMEAFTLGAGAYAVFNYRGNSNGASKAFQYIFQTWLPCSGYVLEDRPHFELLGKKYKNNADDSEEEIWIPVRPLLKSRN